MAQAPLVAEQRYGAPARGLHWVLAAAIVGTFVLGLYMHELPFSPQRLKLYSWHKWAGVTILVLSVLRLCWRLVQAPPALPASIVSRMPGWQQKAHHATHALFYVLFFAVPLSGWAYSSAAGFPVVWFGVLPLPDWVPVDKGLADTLKQVHKVLNFGLLGLVLLHVAAVVKHQFLDRDGLMDRMLVRRR